MKLYEGEPWAKLVTQMGMIPEETEAQARRVAAFAAEKIEELLRDAEEHDRLWATSMKHDREKFAELRRDLGLPPTRLSI